MATHNAGATNSDGVRRFSIMREKKEKEGRPFFFEYIGSALPEDRTQNSKYELRTSGDGEKTYAYELFSAIDGTLIEIKTETVERKGVQETVLCAVLTDGPDTYKVTFGDPSGRNSLSFLTKILDPKFNPAQTLRITPYAFTDDQGKQRIGVSLMNGVDAKMDTKREENPNLAEIPKASEVILKGKKVLDFYPIAIFLMKKVHEVVVPKLKKDPIATTSRTATPVPAPTQHENVAIVVNGFDGDDLPF